MPPPLKAIIGLLSVALVLLGLTVGLASWRLTRSFPHVAATHRLPALHGPVEIGWDRRGVPHIAAGSLTDAFVAAGYCAAQDRFWQMELSRRIAAGRLAEVLGERAVESDRLFRTLGLGIVARQAEQALDDTTRAVLTAYAAGVNGFLATHQDRLPVEFDLLGYTPEPWQPIHSLLALELDGWATGSLWATDATLGAAAVRLGPSVTDDLAPGDPVPGATIPTGTDEATLTALVGLTDRVRELLGAASGGGNAWVLGPSRTASGKPILAAAPHLGAVAPSRFYELHLTAPGLDLAGLTLPGVPGFPVGHSPTIAWAATRLPTDEADLFVLAPDSADPTRYRIGDRSLAFAVRADTIRIHRPGRATPDIVTLTTRLSVYGPVVSDLTAHSGRPIAVRWIGMDPSNPIRALLSAAQSTGWASFGRAWRGYDGPPSWVLYADTAGTIGALVAGRLPERSPGIDAALPIDGSRADADWRGWTAPSALPTLVNPADGYIVAADTRPAGLSPSAGRRWAPGARYERVRTMIEGADQGMLSANDVQQMQQDVRDLLAEQFLPELLGDLDGLRLDDTGRALVAQLRTWDLRQSRGSVAATVFNSWWNRLLHDTFADELGPTLYAAYARRDGLATAALSKLLEAPAAPDSLHPIRWMDDQRTSNRTETRADIVRRTFAATVADLTHRFGADRSGWAWEKVHTVTFRHPLAGDGAIDRVMNLGPHDLPGTATTVDAAGFDPSAPFDVTTAAAARLVIDLNEPGRHASVLSTGQSGQPLSRHYDDQTELWLSGRYNEVLTDRAAIARTAWPTTRLVP